jgi:N-acetylglucosaminyldiphosphoundecaprenol N-acetyl-beta-D-mannosaminyltransferase
VYFLGATQEVLDTMLVRIAVRHPRLRIAGAQHGYFRDEDGERVADAVAAARPDMLFLGISSPRKEIFMARHGPRMQVPICHGVGGSFDVLAGVVPRAPVSWQNTGLEWLFRLLQEPRRMWKRYLVTNSLFTLWVGREWLRQRLQRTVSADRR